MTPITTSHHDLVSDHRNPSVIPSPGDQTRLPAFAEAYHDLDCLLG